MREQIEGAGSLVLEKMTSVTWYGAFIGGIGTLSEETWFGIGGFSIALLAMMTNVWYKRRLISIAQQRLDREFPPNN